MSTLPHAAVASALREGESVDLVCAAGHALTMTLVGSPTRRLSCRCGRCGAARVLGLTDVDDLYSWVKTHQHEVLS